MLSPSDPGVQFLQRDFTDWSVVRSFFCANGHNRHQIDGFNKFCHDILPHITTTQQPVRAYTDAEVHTIRFRGVSIHRPNMTEADGHTHSLQPFEARTRNLTYACPVFADIEYTVEARSKQHIDEEQTELSDEEALDLEDTTFKDVPKDVPKDALQDDPENPEDPEDPEDIPVEVVKSPHQQTTAQTPHRVRTCVACACACRSFACPAW